MGRLRQLPFRKAVEIAWKNIRVRWTRAILVTSGIVLPIAFLSYILCSDALLRQVMQTAPGSLLETLQQRGVLSGLDNADARTQTWWLVGLALLVSFVGVLNAMLLSVTERFAEIGTMKCLGALDGLIIKLFLLEGLFQGLIGTAAGIAVGLGLTLIEGAGMYGGHLWRFFPAGELAQLVGLCFVVGTGIAVVGALYPAWRAARMQPVNAMRSEV